MTTIHKALQSSPAATRNPTTDQTTQDQSPDPPAIRPTGAANVPPVESSLKLTQGTTVRHPSEPKQIRFSDDGLDSLTEEAGYASAEDFLKNVTRMSKQEFLSLLDRDDDGTITKADLDRNGDKMVTRNELEYLKQTARKESGPILTTRPQALPEKTLTGPVLVQVNNPETVTGPGLVFTSNALDPPAKLGTGSNPNLRLFTFANVERNPPESKFGPGPVYQAVVIRNPKPGTGQGTPITVKVQGSSYTKTQIQLKDQYEGPGGGKMSANGGEVRQADYQLSRDILEKDYNLQTPEDGISLAPGEEMIIYVRVDENTGKDPSKPIGPKNPARPTADNDLRAFYDISVDPALPESSPLEVKVAMTQQLPKGVDPNKARHVTKLGSTALPAAFQSFIKTSSVVKGKTIEHLAQGSRLDHPAELVQDLARWKEKLQNPPASWNAKDEKSWLSNKYCGQLLTRLDSMIERFSRTETSTAEDYDMMNAWNMELKSTQQLLNDSGQGAVANELWPMMFKLGRVNGVIDHSVIESTIDVTLGPNQPQQTYTFLGNPLNRGGAGLSQNPEVVNMTQFPGSKPDQPRPANLEATSYGDYGMAYRINLKVDNPTGKPQPLNLSLGTPDEFGKIDFRHLFDAHEAFVDDTRSRFTGVLKLTINDKEFILNMVHGRVQTPQSVEEMLEKPEQYYQDLVKLLAGLPADKPTVIELEFMVPTNDTGPHVLQVAP